MVESGLNNVEFARRVGVNPTQMSKWRSGEVTPRGDNFERLCRRFRVNPTWIYGGSPAPKRLPDGEQLRVAAIPVRADGRGNKPLNDWLRGTSEGRKTSAEEKAFLRGCPWPEDILNVPHEAYRLVLAGFRLAIGGGNGEHDR